MKMNRNVARRKPPTVGLDKVFQQAFRYPLRILDIALTTGQLLDEVWIDKLEFHEPAKFVPHGHPIDGGALHGGLRQPRSIMSLRIWHSSGVSTP